MTLLGNCLWFVLGGWLVGLIYLLGAVVFFPLLPFLLPLVGFAFWPFGREIVSRSDLEAYKKARGVEVSSSETSKNAVGGLANILWAVTFGWLLAVIHLVCVFINVALFWMIVTIPNIGGNWKLMKIAFAPFNRVVVPGAVAEEIRSGAAKAKLGV